MAILSIRIEDDLEQVYAKRGAGNSRKAIERTLLRFKDVDPDSRFFLLSNEGRKALEQIVGGHIPSERELLERIQSVLRIKVGGVDIPITETQARRLETQAKFSGKSVEEYAKQRLTAAVRSVVEG